MGSQSCAQHRGAVWDQRSQGTVVHWVVNGLLLLTSNLAAEKHTNLSIGYTGHSIWCLCLLPSLQSINPALKLSKSSLDYEHDYARKLCVSFPMLHEQLKDGYSLFIVPFPTIIC